MKWQSLLLILMLSVFNPCAFAGGDSPQVIIKKFEFIPQQITIKRGQTITCHSVWFEALGEEEPDYIFPDETYEREFKQTGSFPYRCGPHPRMTGTVHVTE